MGHHELNPIQESSAVQLDVGVDVGEWVTMS